MVKRKNPIKMPKDIIPEAASLPEPEPPIDNLPADDTPLTEAELDSILGGSQFGSTQLSKDEQSTAGFLWKVVESPSTLKLGNIDTIEELGSLKRPIRSNLRLSWICKTIFPKPEWADYFFGLAEIDLASSLSLRAKLIEALVTLKRQTSPVFLEEQIRKKNKGWFGRKRERFM